MTMVKNTITPLELVVDHLALSVVHVHSTLQILSFNNFQKIQLVIRNLQPSLTLFQVHWLVIKRDCNCPCHKPQTCPILINIFSMSTKDPFH